MRTVDTLNKKLNVVVQKLKAWLKKVTKKWCMMLSKCMVSWMYLRDWEWVTFFHTQKTEMNFVHNFFKKRKENETCDLLTSCTTTNRWYWWLITVCFIRKIPLLRAVTPERPHWMGAGDPWAANSCSLWSGREVGNSCGMAWHGKHQQLLAFSGEPLQLQQGVGNLLQEGGLSVRISLPTTTTKGKVQWG